MYSMGQKHGGCGHLMASFDSHSFCARCREKGKGIDPCISHNDCTACNSLTEEQRLQLSTPSYRLKKENVNLRNLQILPRKTQTVPLSLTRLCDGSGSCGRPGGSSIPGFEFRKEEEKA